MIEQNPLCPERVRKITGSFAFLEHRFLRDGFWATLSQPALLLYICLVLVADRHGLSYDSFDKICTRLQLALDEDLAARNTLVQRDLIAFDGHLFQVLSLPSTLVRQPPILLHSAPQMAQADPATIRGLVRDSLGANYDYSTYSLREPPPRPQWHVRAQDCAHPGYRSSERAKVPR